MKKTFTFITFSLFLLVFQNNGVLGNGWYVDPIGGSDSNTGDQLNPFLTLSYAVSAASYSDTIYIGNGTITADGTSGAGITLNKHLVIIGSGPANTIIEGAATPGTANRGVFAIPSSCSYDITIKDLTIQNGYRIGVAPYEGGAICNEGSGKLSLENVSVLHNQSSRGGSISHQIGKLFIKDCYFADNIGNYGGAIYRGDDSSPTDSLVVENSTFFQNTASYAGGACFLERVNGRAVFTNCTFKGNLSQSAGGGGAVKMQDGNFNYFINCTVAQNHCSYGGAYRAGGIETSGSYCYLFNTIVTNNTTANGPYADVYGNGNPIDSYGYNLLGNTEYINTSTGDVLGANSGLDLANYGMNGGPVPTIPLLSCSQAIDAGDATNAPAYPANAVNRFGNIDIGAYEYAGAHTFPAPVTNIIGSDTLVCVPGPLATGRSFYFNWSQQDPGNISYTWSTPGTGANIYTSLTDTIIGVDFISIGSTTSEVLSVVSHDVCGQTSPPTNFLVYKPEIARYFNKYDANCAGQASGSIEIVPYGTTGPYTYLWGGGETTAMLNGVIAGSYSVTVTDGYGCVITDNDNVGEPAPLAINFTSSNMQCYSDSCTGQISTNITGGGMGARTTGGGMYSYSWSNGEVTSFLDDLCEGTYTLNVTDMFGCTAVDSVAITKPAAFTVSLAVGNINCNGANSGQIDATPSGGTGAYYYYWMPNGETSSSIISIGPGQYNLYVTDDNGCIIADSAIVTEPSEALSISYTPVNLLCGGDANGQIDITVNGGTLPYSYAWDNSATTEDLSGLSGGIYAVTVTDGFNCIVSETISISEPMPMFINSLTSNNVTCFGLCDGNAQAIMSGGTQRMTASGNYMYSWSNGDMDNYLNDACAGTYYLTVTDQNGCTLNDEITITEPAALTLNLTVAQINCFGNNNGQIDVNVTGGTGSYYYSWSNSITDWNIISLGPGQYNVNVLDDNGCTASDSAVIIEPAVLTSFYTQVDLICGGASNGSVDLTVNGGTLPYSFNWSNSASTEDLTGISGGYYSVTVIDAYNCSTTEAMTINEPGPLSAGLTSTDITCFGLCDGQGQVYVNGGTGSIYYNWSNGATTYDVNSLCAGTHNLTVTDDNGCTLMDSILILEPSLLTINKTITDINCFGRNDGQISVSVSGGTGAYGYQWWPYNQTTANINGLPANHYFVTVIDANNCTVMDSMFVMEPADLITSTIKTDVACNATNGTIGTNVSGGTSPYAYLWNNNSTNGNLIGLSAGNYSVIISDVNGCADTLSESILSLGNNPVITGMIYRGNTGDTIKSGVVEIYELTQSGAYTLYTTANIDVAGHYMASVPVGQYLVLDKANGATYPGTKPTYYGNTFRWDLAVANNATCDSVLTSNINVIQLTILNGQATISGSVFDITNGKTTVQGDPIPGVDVSLEQNPGSVMLAQTATDNNGYFQFTNVPVGTGYTIHVDIPGLPLVSTYTIDITPSTISVNNNFYVDSTSHIDTIPPVVTGVKHYIANVAKSILKTYPNPFKNSATVELGLTDRSKVLIEVYNVLGAKVEVLENSIKEKGLYTYSFGNDIDGYSAGVYFVKTTINGAATTQRIVKSE